MHTTLRCALAAAAVLVAGCAAGTAATGPSPGAGGAAADAALTGRYHGVLMDVGNVLPRTGAERLNVWIDRLTPAAEARRLADLQQDVRQDALRAALADLRVGRVQIGQGTSYPIAAALAFDGDDGMRHLVLVIARPISLREIFGAARSADYPFSVIELDLDERGEGSGELNVATRISLTAEGRVLIDELAVQPLRILGVERVER